MGIVLHVAEIEAASHFYQSLGFVQTAAFTLLVPDLATVYQSVRAAGLEILLEPMNEFYGDRVVMFLDPNGYEWKISQTIAEVSKADVGEIIAAT